MQAIVGTKHRTLKHDLESLEGAIKLWMYEHCDFSQADVDFAIQHLNPTMLQDLAECPNNLDVSKGQRHANLVCYGATMFVRSWTCMSNVLARGCTSFRNTCDRRRSLLDCPNWDAVNEPDYGYLFNTCEGFE